MRTYNSIDIQIGAIYYLMDPRFPKRNLMVIKNKDFIERQIWNNVLLECPEARVLGGISLAICKRVDYTLYDIEFGKEYLEWQVISQNRSQVPVAIFRCPHIFNASLVNSTIREALSASDVMQVGKTECFVWEDFDDDRLEAFATHLAFSVAKAYKFNNGFESSDAIKCSQCYLRQSITETKRLMIRDMWEGEHQLLTLDDRDIIETEIVDTLLAFENPDCHKGEGESFSYDSKVASINELFELIYKYSSNVETLDPGDGMWPACYQIWFDNIKKSSDACDKLIFCKTRDRRNRDTRTLLERMAEYSRKQEEKNLLEGIKNHFFDIDSKLYFTESRIKQLRNSERLNYINDIIAYVDNISSSSTLSPFVYLEKIIVVLSFYLRIAKNLEELDYNSHISEFFGRRMIFSNADEAMGSIRYHVKEMKGIEVGMRNKQDEHHGVKLAYYNNNLTHIFDGNNWVSTEGELCNYSDVSSESDIINFEDFFFGNMLFADKKKFINELIDELDLANENIYYTEDDYHGDDIDCYYTILPLSFRKYIRHSSKQNIKRYERLINILSGSFVDNLSCEDWGKLFTKDTSIYKDIFSTFTDFSISKEVEPFFEKEEKEVFDLYDFIKELYNMYHTPGLVFLEEDEVEVNGNFFNSIENETTKEIWDIIFKLIHRCNIIKIGMDKTGILKAKYEEYVNQDLPDDAEDEMKWSLNDIFLGSTHAKNEQDDSVNENEEQIDSLLVERILCFSQEFTDKLNKGSEQAYNDFWNNVVADKKFMKAFVEKLPNSAINKENMNMRLFLNIIGYLKAKTNWLSGDAKNLTQIIYPSKDGKMISEWASGANSALTDELRTKLELYTK